jgi:hypothetical protein
MPTWLVVRGNVIGVLLLMEWDQRLRGGFVVTRVVADEELARLRAKQVSGNG